MYQGKVRMYQGEARMYQGKARGERSVQLIAMTNIHISSFALGAG